MNARTRSNRSDWLVPALLILLSIVPALGGAFRLVELGRGAEITGANARFFAMPILVLIHIPAATLFSFLGALQFSPRFRRRNLRWHRVAGRIVGVAGLIVAVSGLWMTMAYDFVQPDGIAVYLLRLLFGAAMLISILYGLWAIRNRDFASHEKWMIRGYAIGMGAGTQVLTHLPWFILVGQPTELPRAVMMGAGWVINVVVAEWIIRRGSARTAVRPAIGHPPTAALHAAAGR